MAVNLTFLTPHTSESLVEGWKGGAPELQFSIALLPYLYPLHLSATPFPQAYLTQVPNQYLDTALSLLTTNRG